MLHYVEFGISHMEVPMETALCIYISGCQNRCADCHYPELQNANEGEVLSDYFEQIGPLTSRTTNQKMWSRLSDGSYTDITKLFWQDGE